MATLSYRVKSIKRGPIPDDGTMSTVLTSIGPTFKDTVTLKGDTATAFDVEVSEQDDPIASYPKKGKKTLAFSLVDKANDSKVAVLGGEIVDGWWEEPLTAPVIEESYQIITQDGYVVQLPRVSISAVENDEYKEGSVGLIDVVGKILRPNGAGVKPSRSRKYQLPVVSAGTAQNVVVATATLNGVATPFLGAIASKLWSCISKPVNAADPTITTPSALTTTVTGLVNGVYKFQLDVKDDNDFENKATITVTVAIP